MPAHTHDHTHRHTHTWPLGRTLKVALVGDSLDRKIVQYICNLEDAKRHGFKETVLVHKRSQEYVCSNGRVRLVSYQLFGLVEPSQPEIAKIVERRGPKQLTWSSEHRLTRLLQKDVPDIHSFDAMTVHSCLWDLSQPVTTSDPLKVRYALQFAEKVRNLSFTLRDEYPTLLRYWRTCPPTNGKRYPLKAELEEDAQITRTQRSQAVLNNAISTVIVQFSQNSDTKLVSHGVMDWDHMMNGQSMMAVDGRHYPVGPALAYFNLFLNALAWDMRTGRHDRNKVNL